MREMSLKKVFAAVLAVLMVVGMAPSLSFAAEGDVNPDVEYDNAIDIFTDEEIFIGAGEIYTLKLNIKNSWSEDLDLSISLEGLDTTIWASGRSEERRVGKECM